MERALKLDKWVCVCAGNIQSMAQVSEHVGGGLPCCSAAALVAVFPAPPASGPNLPQTY